MLRTQVSLGDLKVFIEAENVEDLLKEVAYIAELDRAREGRPATPFFRAAGGYEYFGFRDAQGAEVIFGKAKKPDDPGHKLFSYARTSEGYKGWQMYQPREG
jgi:hypothetical protein